MHLQWFAPELQFGMDAAMKDEILVVRVERGDWWMMRDLLAYYPEEDSKKKWLAGAEKWQISSKIISNSKSILIRNLINAIN